MSNGIKSDLISNEVNEALAKADKNTLVFISDLLAHIEGLRNQVEYLHERSDFVTATTGEYLSEKGLAKEYAGHLALAAAANRSNID